MVFEQNTCDERLTEYYAAVKSFEERGFTYHRPHTVLSIDAVSEKVSFPAAGTRKTTVMEVSKVEQILSEKRLVFGDMQMSRLLEASDYVGLVRFLDGKEFMLPSGEVVHWDIERLVKYATRYSI